MPLSLFPQTKSSETLFFNRVSSQEQSPSSRTQSVSPRAAINSIQVLSNFRNSETTSRINTLSRKTDNDWQKLSLGQLKQAGLFSEIKRTVQGKEVSLQTFSLDKGAQNSISISPQLGAGLMSLKLSDREIISSPLVQNDLKDSKVASLEGMQLISPPNRTLNAEIKFKDADQKNKSINLNKLAKAANLSVESEGKNNIHGIFGKMPWELASVETNREGDFKITYSMNTTNNKALKEGLGEAEFKMTYTLSKATDNKPAELKTSINVQNQGNNKSANGGIFPLIGVGWHPYFNTSSDATFNSSVTAQLEKNKGQLPTGSLKKISEADSLNTGRLASKNSGPLDDHFILKSNQPSEQSSTVIQNKDARGEYSIEISQNTKELPFQTLYNGADNKLCVEPLSSSPNAANMDAVKGNKQNVELKANAILLKPQENFNATFSIRGV